MSDNGRSARMQRLGVIGLAVLATAALVAIVGPTRSQPEPPPLGPAQRDLVALRAFDDAEPVPDLRARQQRAADAVPVHYAFDAEAANRRVDGIRDAFRLVRPRERLYLAERERAERESEAAGRAAAEAAQQNAQPLRPAGKRRVKAPAPEPTPAPAPVATVDLADLEARHEEEMSRLRPEFESRLLGERGELDARVFQVLRREGFAEDVELLLSDAVQVLLGQRIVRLEERLQDDLGRGLLDQQSGKRYGRGDAEGLAVDVDAAKRLADAYVDEFIRRKRPSRFDSAEVAEAARVLVRAMVAPTFVRDLEATQRAENAAREGVPKTRVVHIARGQSLVKRGDMVTPAVQRRVRLMLSGVDHGGGARALGATALLVAMLVGLFAAYATRYLEALRRRPKDAVLLGAILLVHAATLRLLLELGELIVDPAGSVTVTMWAVLLPHALGPTLATLFLRPPVALPFALLCSGVAGVAAQSAPLLRAEPSLPGLVTLVAVLLGLAGVYATRRFRTRADLAIGGLQVTLAGLGAGVAVALWTAPPGSDLLDAQTGLVLAMGAASGALGYLLVAALTPLFESAFNRLTDIKLLELTSMNHPALRLLATETPGTFTHSVMVGNLAEAACDAIGANGLLARVGAYYHDVGKSTAPLYFAENQSGDNPHDRLKPHLSALIIKGHVKDGIRLLREFGLPEEIVDFVPQHHGTSLIEHFYNRARREATEGEEVVEGDFRYPGPKPQTKETALLMIADTLEAAAKAMPEPTPERVRALVSRLIARKLEDNQLDECDMTLRELAAVEKAFTRVLVGMHHTRPVYLPAPKEQQRRSLLDAARAMRQRGVVETVRTPALTDTDVDGDAPVDPAFAATTTESAVSTGDESEPESPTAVLAARRSARP